MTTPHPYASEAYASAFAPEYQPIYLKESQTYVLKRPIPGTRYCDAMGCYPLCAIAENADLEKDFGALKEQGVVSLVLVTDPFFHPPLPALQEAFNPVLPYKQHYLHDFRKDRTYSKHHRDRIKTALKKLEVRRISLSDYLSEWAALYQSLTKKHNIQGIQAFTPGHFRKLCALEPLMFGAFQENVLVSGHLCFEHAGYAYSHLTASSEEGYHLRATFALYDYTLRYFAENGAKAFDFGAGAGLTDTSDGLTQFKKGFSNAEATCYLCGKILDEVVYAQLSAGKQTAFFPAYRS